jgi:hypothetical protein
LAKRDLPIFLNSDGGLARIIHDGGFLSDGCSGKPRWLSAEGLLMPAKKNHDLRYFNQQSR